MKDAQVSNWYVCPFCKSPEVNSVMGEVAWNCNTCHELFDKPEIRS